MNLTFYLVVIINGIFALGRNNVHRIHLRSKIVSRFGVLRLQPLRNNLGGIVSQIVEILLDQDEIPAIMTIRILEVVLLCYLGKFVLRQKPGYWFFAGVALKGFGQVYESSVFHHLRVIRPFPRGHRSKTEGSRRYGDI